MKIKTFLLFLLFFQLSHVVFASPIVNIRWLGGPTMEITFNGMTILTDPMLGEGSKAFLMGDPNEQFDLTKGPNVKHHARVNSLPHIDLHEVDLVLLSHAHEDHFDQTAHRKLDSTINIVLPTEDVAKVKALGFSQLKALDYGNSMSFKAGKGTIKVTAIPADHSTNLALTPILGNGLGYLLQFSQSNWQKTIYWTGDSMPTDKVFQAVTSVGKIDLLIPNMGAVGTTGPLGQISMGADDAIKFAKRLNVNNILPIHHSTYELYLEPIVKLVDKAKKERELQVTILKEGETTILH